MRHDRESGVLQVLLLCLKSRLAAVEGMLTGLKALELLTKLEVV
jgi:hypothetical protein